MMRVCNPSTMSVLGLYNYDSTLFNNMAFPTLFTTDDKTTFLNNLLMEVAELEVIYTNPSFMKFAIENWSKKELSTWERIYAAAHAEYDPIENYNRMETSTDTTEGTRKHTGTDTTTNTGTDTTTNSGTDTVTNSGKDTNQASGTDSSNNTVTNSGSDATTRQTAAFNSTSLVDSGRESTAYGHAQNTTASLTHGQKEELTYGHVEATQHGHVEALQHGHTMATQHGEQIAEDMEVTRESTIHGNIGVTTSQQMLEQELEVVPKLNVINYMIDSFKNRFCILVY